MNQSALKLTRAFALAAGVGFSGAAMAKDAPKGCSYVQSGMASWYGNEMAKYWKDGRPVFNPTASGEKFDPSRISAAHKNLPLGTHIWVRTSDGNTLRTRVNDRGPYAKGRVLDLSKAAAQALGFEKRGEVRVDIFRCPA
ncbi:MAG: septal ring lytic transglycosylase RlpA family protein [Micavibrio sp.]